MTSVIERRRHRRANLGLPVEMRPAADAGGKTPSVIGRLRNAGLAGFYCTVDDPSPFTIGQKIICSISVPPEEFRAFPFSRVMGRAWVVRVEPVPMGRREGEAPPGQPKLGMAVAFAPDVTALGSVRS